MVQPFRRGEDLRAAVVFVAGFLAAAFFAAALFFLAGIWAPACRASLNPMAMACLGFRTFWPDPDLSRPCLNSLITSPTLARATAVDALFFDALFFFAGMILPISEYNFGEPGRWNL